MVAALLLVHGVLAVGSMRQTSLTWDEPSYIGVGRQFIETGNPQIVALQLHPPLSYYLNSFPLLFLEFDAGTFTNEDYIYNRYIGPALLFESQYSPDTILFLSRLPFVFVSILLALVIWGWSKRLFGDRAGLLAVFLYALSPTVLAHCRLATADILVAFTVTLTLYSFFIWLEERTAVWLVAAGGTLGLALLSKFSAMMLIPIIFLVTSLDWLEKRDAAGGLSLVNRLVMLAVMFAIAAVVVWAGYGFQVVTPFMPQWLQPDAERLFNEKPFWRAVGVLADHGVRLPAYSYLLGIYTQLAAAKGWKDNFLFGQISSSGWWYFYWAAFLIKTPLPFIVCLGAAFFMKGPGGRSRGERYLLGSIVPMIIFFSIPTRINIGIRYLLPLYPLLFTLVGKVGHIDSRNWRVVVGVLCVWYAASAGWTYPNYLAYFNELVGGPGNGYRYLVDSNLDWGQSLGELDEYLKREGIEKARIKYFGPVAALEYHGLKNVDLDNCEPSTGVWVISATYLQNLYLSNPHCHDWLRELKPEKVIGYSIFVYEVSAEDLPHEPMHDGAPVDED
ncbi:MAG: phospholipid carrier-dependent glycosyltransferase [Candidatus Abyssubacteria bacterium]